MTFCSGNIFGEMIGCSWLTKKGGVINGKRLGYITKMTSNYPAKHIIFSAMYFRSDDISL